jgi:dTDP-4-amino-4,6-dideoxygalactose transaminase
MSEAMIPITRPVLDDNEVGAVRRAILSGWITQGPEVLEFEREFAHLVGAPHACAVSSCTAALHMALLALGIQPGDEVITVSHTFIATCNSIRYCGAKPVFVDIEPLTYNIDIKKIKAALTEKTKAILCVHQMGMPCDLGALLSLAQKNNLPVVEDAACALGSQIDLGHGWEFIGKPHGDIACFSFHPRKIISTGDGGMLVTRNPELDQTFRLLRQHGMSVPDTVRHASGKVIFEEYTRLGYNYRLTDIQAAIGREQLKRLPDLVARRRVLAERYRQLLHGLPEVEAPREPHWARSNWQSFCVHLRACQRQVMQSMLDAGIMTRRGIMSCHRERAYADDFGAISLPCSEDATDHAILLPLYPTMTEGEQDRVIDALGKAISRFKNESSYPPA